MKEKCPCSHEEVYRDLVGEMVRSHHNLADLLIRNPELTSKLEGEWVVKVRDGSIATATVRVRDHAVLIDVRSIPIDSIQEADWAMRLKTILVRASHN